MTIRFAAGFLPLVKLLNALRNKPAQCTVVNPMSPYKQWFKLEEFSTNMVTIAFLQALPLPVREHSQRTKPQLSGAGDLICVR